MKTLFVRLRFALSFLLLGSSLLALPPSLMAQEGLTSEGTDFWLGFMPNYLDPAAYLSLFIGSATDNDVHVDVYGGSQVPVEYWHQTMTANSIWTIAAKSSALWETRQTETLAYRAIHVYAKNPIVVYGLSNVYTTTDSYLGLPTAGLGKEYYSVCYYDDHYTLGSPGNLAGEFLIVAPFDSTVVTIGPVTTPTRAATPMNGPSGPDGQTILHRRGDTWSVTLMRGQTYMVQSTGLAYGDDDITGTHIVATKPVSLLSGHVRASVPIGERADQNGSKNHLIEMLPSLDKWGTQYFDMPMTGRTLCGDMVRVVAGEDNVSVFANGSQVALLVHAGDFVDLQQILEPTAFTSNGKRFLAVMYSYSYGYLDDTSTNADPFIITLTPKEQFQKKLFFRTPSSVGGGTYRNYATFICLADSISKIQIDGKSIGSFPLIGQGIISGSNPRMATRRIQLPASSTHFATCGAPFSCYMYGLSYADGYGHPAGLALKTLSPDTIPPRQSADSSCGNVHIKLMETRHFPVFAFNDVGIADIALITDSNDLRWNRPSANYRFAMDSAHSFVPGDSTASFTLTVIDPTQDAYASVWATDRAGNDTVYQYSYTAPRLTVDPASLNLGNVRVSSNSCTTITFRNAQTTALAILGMALPGRSTSGVFTVKPDTLNRVLRPGDTVQLHLCFAASDTGSANDTLYLNIGCIPLPYPLSATGVSPIIVANDLDFGTVKVGDTLCRNVAIRNTGNAPLIIDQKTFLHDTIDFSFDVGTIPITIQPGGSIVLTVCFHPHSTGQIISRLDWGTNLPPPLAHEQKDTSQLIGFGVSAGVTSPGDVTASLSISPNPTSGSVVLRLEEASSANIQVFDILGREIDHFTMSGRYEWQTNRLPSGTYIIRAVVGDRVLSKRVVKE